LREEGRGTAPVEDEERRKREEKRREILEVKKLGLFLKVNVKNCAVYVAF